MSHGRPRRWPREVPAGEEGFELAEEECVRLRFEEGDEVAEEGDARRGVGVSPHIQQVDTYEIRAISIDISSISG